MAITAIGASEVRGNFSEVLGRVAYGKERGTIERRGRPVAVLLPIEDLARIEAGALRSEIPGVNLLLTDVILPGERSGPAFAETAQRHNPAIEVLFMSGYPAESPMPRAGGLDRDTPLLPKPFRKAALAKAVRNALDDGEKISASE